MAARVAADISGGADGAAAGAALAAGGGAVEGAAAGAGEAEAAIGADCAKPVAGASSITTTTPDKNDRKNMSTPVDQRP
jgi:hypothetical protein